MQWNRDERKTKNGGIMNMDMSTAIVLYTWLLAVIWMGSWKDALVSSLVCSVDSLSTRHAKNK
jgi:hypothetical protein